MDARDEARGLIDRYGWLGMVRILARMLAPYAHNPDSRRFVREVRMQRVDLEKLTGYFGYDLYVGRK